MDYRPLLLAGTLALGVTGLDCPSTPLEPISTGTFLYRLESYCDSGVDAGREGGLHRGVNQISRLSLGEMPSPALLVFWTPPCYPCTEAAPQINRFYRDFKGKVHFQGVLPQNRLEGIDHQRQQVQGAEEKLRYVIESNSHLTMEEIVRMPEYRVWNEESSHLNQQHLDFAQTRVLLCNKVAAKGGPYGYFDFPSAVLDHQQTRSDLLPESASGDIAALVENGVITRRFSASDLPQLEASLQDLSH